MPRSLARQGFFRPKAKETLVVQGKCLTLRAKTSLITGNFPKRQEVAVNRSDLVEAVAGSTGLEKRQAESAVTAFIDAVMSEAKAGNKVSIFGFGTFTPT